jgi:2-keto-3-deoxy-L-rhamnonate aldolase RhmA
MYGSSSNETSPRARRPTTPETKSFAGTIKAEEVIIGAAVSLGSVSCAQIVARAGFQWVLIDMEHAPTSVREATEITHAVVAASAGDCVAIVRTPSHGVEWIKWALDSGAAGIIIPMVQNREECAGILQRALYPPLGQRSFGPFLAPFADTNSSADVATYMSKRSKELAIIPMIESVEGVERAEEILSVKGVTGCFVGPFDLRQSMNLQGGDGEEPMFIEALEKILDIGKRYGVEIGTVAATEEAVRRKKEMGFSFLLAGSDVSFLATGCQNAWQQCSRGLSTARVDKL